MLEGVTGAMDPIDLAQRLAAILDGGRRVATYKLATLLAMLDACAEAETPPGPDEAFALSILDLADRVIDLYWPQVRTYNDAGLLRQSTQSRSRILEEVIALHQLAPRAATVRLGHIGAYEQARRRVAHTLARQPLPKLQTPGGQATTRTCFLYDDSWLGEDVAVRELDARGWTLELLPGVADSLVRLGGLLRPVIERAWTDDVARLNHLDTEYADLPRFLFGAERSSLARAASVLREIEGHDCFYCNDRDPRSPTRRPLPALGEGAVQRPVQPRARRRRLQRRQVGHAREPCAPGAVGAARPDRARRGRQRDRLARRVGAIPAHRARAVLTTSYGDAAVAQAGRLRPEPIGAATTRAVTSRLTLTRMRRPANKRIAA